MGGCWQPSGVIVQILGAVGGSEKLVDPTLSVTATTCSGFTVSITNYLAINTYTVSASAGSVSRTAGTITVTGLAKGQSSTITVTASRAGFISSSAAITSSSQAACSSCSFASSSIEFCGCFDGIQWNYNVTFQSGNPSGCCPADCPAIVSSCYSTGSVGVC
jgi:hypothetical protein